MSAQQPFFTFSGEQDEIMIYYAAQNALKKKAMGAKLNFKEAGLVICKHIIEEAAKGKPVRTITRSARRVLQSKDVMLGVPVVMESITVNARFRDGRTRQVVVENPIKAESDDLSLSLLT